MQKKNYNLFHAPFSYPADETAATPVCWNDLLRYETLFAEHTDRVPKLIKFKLGYIPPKAVWQSYDIKLRELIHLAVSDKISDEFLNQQLEIFCRYIRNADMALGGWVQNLSITEKYLYHYENYLYQFKEKSFQRLCNVLAYEPDLISSIHAQVLLRELFVSDQYYEGCPFNEYDCKAATITEYRKVYIESGKEAADDMATFGLL